MRCDIETLSIDGVSNTEHFYGKTMQNIVQKVNPRPLFNLAK